VPLSACSWQIKQERLSSRIGKRQSTPSLNPHAQLVCDFFSHLARKRFQQESDKKNLEAPMQPLLVLWPKKRLSLGSVVVPQKCVYCLKSRPITIPKTPGSAKCIICPSNAFVFRCRKSKTPSRPYVAEKGETGRLPSKAPSPSAVLGREGEEGPFGGCLDFRSMDRRPIWGETSPGLLTFMTIVVWFPLPEPVLFSGSGGEGCSSSSGIGGQYSLSTFFSCGRRMGLELSFDVSQSSRTFSTA
jgi:hypothetical protein